MANLWESVKETASSLGGAAIAPIGAVWDVASTVATAPFDDDDDSFGDVVNKVAGRGADLLDPLLNNSTLTGAAFGGVMQGLEWMYREGVSEPLVTTNTMLGHAYSGNIGDLFSGETWGEAYDVAQDRSIGQSVALDNFFTGQHASLKTGTGPLDERAWKQYQKHQGDFISSLESGAYDFAARWYLDPGVVIGKAAMAGRAAKKYRKVTGKDMPGGTLSDDAFEATHGVSRFERYNPFTPDNLGTRTEKYLDFINRGANGAPLNGAQIFVATPELARSATGRQIAGLLADAGKIEDVAVRTNAQRRILSVAWGDTDAIAGASDELAQMGAMGDALKNMLKGNVLDLKAYALGPHIAASPELAASFQGQLDNLDDVAKFADSHVRKLEALLDVGDSLTLAPGVQKAGKRALNRAEGKGLLRDGRLQSGPEKVRETSDWVVERAQRLGQHVATSSIYQKSAVHVPLKVITHTARIATWDYGRAPMRVADALRTSHLQGYVSTHDWNGAVTQLDSMLQLAKVTPGERMALLSGAQMARHETDKMVAIERVEKAAMRGLVTKHAISQGDMERAGARDVGEFIETVMSKGHAKRTSHLAALNGRAYAATKNQMDDAAGRVDQIRPRVDLIDDVDGAPVALPLLETQGRNMVPLFDAHLADKMLKREYGRLAKHAEVWSQAGREIGRLKQLQATTGKSMQKALKSWYAVQDHAVDAATFAMRTWKFSVLFRLGYPLRVVSDDHMRIWSQIGGMSIMAPVARESLGNVWYNQSKRYRMIRKDADEARVRLAAIRSTLDDDAAIAAWQSRADEVKTLNRKIAAARSAGNQQRLDTLTVRRDMLQEQLGDSPADLLREQDELTTFLDLSRKEQMAVRGLAKKQRGEKSLTLDGIEYEGAFGGELGDAYRVASSSSATFDNLAKVAEERLFKNTAGQGAWRVIHNDDPAHHVAWADTLNNQFRQSKVAMFFVKDPDATVPDFVRWLKQPEQRGLRERLPHFAHDPEDWGWRVKQLVDDYIPTAELREQLVKGRVNAGRLDRMFADVSQRPAIHGATVAHNVGDISRFATSVGATMNRLYRMIGELPTDRLSRHPYFAAMYEREVRRLHAKRLGAAQRKGEGFTQKDVDDIVNVARRNALNDLRRTLFDISAHSNAAHVMRFVSPFFAAHQEVLSRWWRIVADDPSVIRRFQQGFDVPRKLGLVVDSETGEPIKEGEMPGPGHSLLLQLPEAWGGASTDPSSPDYKPSTGWRINENSFNLILQNGILNPGIGPIVQLPVEAVVQKHAQYEELERVARLLNPYPPESLGDLMMPATVRRARTIIQKEKSAEYSRMFATNIQDKIVDFRLANGDREPTQAEMAQIERDARNETNMEAWLRFFQNALSPAPASPRSRFEVFRQGWRKINEQAEQEGHDYDWRIEKFREKYGDAYLPMIASSANNPGDLDATNETVAALKKHRKIIDSVDIRFAGAIVGSAGKYQSAEDYSNTARKWLRDNTHRYSEDPYHSYDNPLAAAREAAVKRGWNDYSRMVDALNGMALDNGLQHYTQSDQLMELKRQFVAGISEKNHFWGEDYTDFNPGEFDTMLDDMQMIVEDKSLKDRADVQVLDKYLKVRKLFTFVLQARDAQGGSADPGAKANADLMEKYRDIVAMLAERNLDFEEFWFNGVIDRDPMLDQTFFKTN